ncbi:MAG: GntR family transcriptional regulator [Pontiellaceae bacterium]
MDTKPHTKEDIAYRYVRKLINSDDIQPGDLLPTETSISEKLCINRMTIAKALASLKNEGYVERRAGRGTTLIRKPAASSSKLIIVIAPWPSKNPKDDWYFQRLVYSIQSEAVRNELATLNVAFHFRQAEEQDFIRIRDLYKAVECTGAIVVDPFMATHSQLQEFLDDLGCPSVWAGSSLKTYKKANRVDIDNYQTAFDLTERLIEDGAEQVGFMSGALETTARQRRFEGYKGALESRGIAYDERLVICHSTPSYLNEAGSECAAIYAARNLNADALFLNDYPMMEGILEFCNRYPNPELDKLKILPISTFDFEDKSTEANVRYSAHQPIEEIGFEAVRIFMQARDKILTDAVVKTLSADIRKI